MPPRGIMTTDTFAKAAIRTAEIGGTTVTIAGIAKGTGMIAPDMATMLGFVFTDAKIPADALQALLSKRDGQDLQLHHRRQRHLDQRHRAAFATGAGQARRGCRRKAARAATTSRRALDEVLHRPRAAWSPATARARRS